jgi:putative transposase
VKRYEFIREQRSVRSVRRMCRVLAVSPSAYYHWQSRGLSARCQADAQLLERISAIQRANRGVYGSPRILVALQREGVRVSRKRVARLMRQNGLHAKTVRRFKVTTRRGRPRTIGVDLVQRHFQIDQPNRLWASDITYIWTREGWTYLAVVLDLYSRRVVGWELSSRLTTDLVTQALSRALMARGSSPGLVFHSDRGCQYTSDELTELLEQHGLQQSLGYSCYDNAVSESFMHTIKTEHLQFVRFETRDAVRPSIFDYIEAFYNQHRIHSTLGMNSPAQFEQLHH